MGGKTDYLSIHKSTLPLPSSHSLQYQNGHSQWRTMIAHILSHTENETLK